MSWKFQVDPDKIDWDMSVEREEYADKIDEARIALAERRAAESTREGRMLRRQHQISVLQAARRRKNFCMDPE